MSIEWRGEKWITGRREKVKEEMDEGGRMEEERGWVKGRDKRREREKRERKEEK